MLKPTTEQELSDIIRDAESAIAIQGGGTRGVQVEGAALTTTGMSGITTYEPGALTLVAKAGTPISEIEAALASENQILAFEPMDHRTLLGTSGEPTIGGVVAANISGPRRVQAGACRDFLLGVRFVDGRGEVVQNGGRVMKNVTGYDLARLQCGAHGTLGVLTEVGLKVLPKPETEATLIYDDLNEVQAIEVMSAAMKSPFEVSGAAFAPVDGTGSVMLRLEGFEGSVRYRAGELGSRLSAFGAGETLIEEAASKEIWKTIRDVSAFRDKSSVTCVSLPPTQLSELFFNAAQVFFDVETRRPLFDILVDWAGGLVWVASDPEPQESGSSLHDWLQSFSAFDGGHSRRIKGGIEPGRQRFQPESPPLKALAAGLRQKFDPRGILNPGLMG